MSSLAPDSDPLDLEDVLPRLRELGALLEGHFRLSSGRHSDRYFQCARILQYPLLATELGRLLGERFDALTTDLVLSPAVGGVVLGQEVARALGRRHVFAERKDGEFTIRRGFEVLKGENVLVVDDVLTRGTSFEEMRALAKAHGATVTGLAVIVDRRENDVTIEVPVVSLVQTEVETYDPGDCPLCREGKPLVAPGSRHVA